MTKAMERLINEGADGFTPTDPMEIAIDAEIRNLRAAWTLEVTTARRAAWNAEMMEAKKAGLKINLANTEAKMGFCLADLKAAILRHKL